MEIKGAVALITGAGSGIGRATAQRLIALRGDAADGVAERAGRRRAVLMA